jgi:hypothetical protein
MYAAPLTANSPTVSTKKVKRHHLPPQPIAIKAQAERARNLNLCFSLTRNRDQSFSQNVNLAKLSEAVRYAERRGDKREL